MEATYHEALERAKENAKGIDPNCSNGTAGTKRPADESGDSPMSQKRVNVNDKFAKASEMAARINQKIVPNSLTGNPTYGLKTVNHFIPDNYVGLIIGKKGEQITRIQRETGCNVQIAQDSNGASERSVTLSGTDDQIEEVKRMFKDIIEKAKYPTGNSTATSSYQQQALPTHQVEMSIPGSRAGLIIGKNGETIRQLQEQTGVKMVLIQDSNAPTENEKPLRISGEPIKVERARQMVIDLLNARITIGGSSGGSGGGGGGGLNPATTFAVPSDKAGLVIGKGGETVKDIMRQSGARVEIQKQPSTNPTIKTFNIYGEAIQVETAIKLICERANIPFQSSNLASNQQYATNQFGANDRFNAANQWSQQQQLQQQQQQQSYNQWGQTPTQGGSPSPMPAPSVNPQTGQPDYTAAWIEFYRRQGMHQQADAIVRHASQNQVGSNQMANAMPQQNQQQLSSGAGVNDYNQWQWQQWQQQQQQQQQQQFVSDGWNQAQARPGN